MAKLIPAIEEIKQNKSYSTEGELHLISYFKENLDDSYEVYFRPFLNGDKPDVIIMKPGVGMYIIEVEGWNLSNYIYTINKLDKFGEMYVRKDNTRIRTPFKKVETYKQNFFGFYSNQLVEKKACDNRYYGVIKCGVYFHIHDEDSLRRYFKVNNNMTLNYINIWGKNSNIAGTIKKWASNISNTLFDDDIYKEIYKLLNQEQHTENMGQYINLDKNQRKLCKSVGNSKVKIKGVAGSGKSIILAHRAVDAVRRTNSTVLILTYNITLRNYIKDRINKVIGNFNWRNFEINHFHLFIYQKVNEYGVYLDYEDSRDNDSFCDNIIEKLESIKDKINRYDSILIDEAQDYDVKWLNIIKNYFLKEDGEFVIFADEKQNIYHRAEIDDDKKIITNINGRWNELNKSFRIGKEIAELASKFQSEFLKEKYALDKIEVSNEQISFDIDPKQDIIFNCVDEFNYVEIFNDINKHAVEYNELCFVGGNIEGLRKLDFTLRNKYSISTLTTFEKEEIYIELLNDDMADSKLYEIRRSKKYNFQMNSEAIKLSTIHSFKGWEIDNLILILDENSDEKINDELIYTAITRCKKNLYIYAQSTSKYYKFFSENCKKFFDLKFKAEDNIAKLFSDISEKDIPTIEDEEFDFNFNLDFDEYEDSGMVYCPGDGNYHEIEWASLYDGSRD